MKKFTLILFLSMITMSLTVIGQNSKVTSGVLDYNKSDDQMAVKRLEEALSDPSKLSVHMVPKAHIYLMMSYLRIGGCPIPSQNPGIAEKFPDAFDKAVLHRDAALATKANAKKSIQKMIDDNMKTSKYCFWRGNYNKAVNAYNEKDYETAKDAFLQASELDKKDYNSFAMAGNSYLFLRDSAQAISTWESARDVYLNGLETKEIPFDSNFSFIFQNLANFYLSYEKDGKKALSSIEKGLELYPTDESLKRTELHVYNSEPELLEEALAKFETARKENPKDNTIAAAYAGLLQKADKKDEALLIYKEILEIDDSHLLANLNVAAHYINDAKVLNEQYLEENNEEKAETLFTQIKEKFQGAYPYMKKTQELDPENPEWINQMITITSYLDIEEEMMKYTKMQQELKNK